VADTRVQFVTAAVKRRLFTQYSQGSVASFGTQFVTDWASVLPNGGTGLGVVAKPGAATTAEVIVAPGTVLEVTPLSWVGYNFGVWEVVAPANMGRTVADGATNTNTTVTSATAAFASPADVGAIIAGPGIPSGTTIVSVTNGTTVVISAAATATATNQPLTISPVAAVYIPDVI
jgi:hypothetical protein